MADWYVSSAAYAGYTAFQASHAYTIGNLIVPTAPTNKNKWVFRCTTAGTSSTEPTWSSAATNNATVTSGGATFTNVTGQSTYFWTAAAGDVPTITGGGSETNVVAAGDRVFISSDHSETQTTTTTYGQNTTAGYGLIQYLSVNRGGSTPPVAGDLTAGATVTVGTGGSIMIIDALCESFWDGVTFIYTAGNQFWINSGGAKAVYLKNGQIYLNTTTTSVRLTTGNPAKLILDNTTLRFGSVSQFITAGNYTFDILWINTPSALAGAIFPTVLVRASAGGPPILVTARGVDLSGTANTLVKNSASGVKMLLDSCKIASGCTRLDTSSESGSNDLVELVNCYDGTHILSEKYSNFGTLTTETTITLSGGATDDVGTFSHKMVTASNNEKFVCPFASFAMDVENTVTGSSKTATVEINSSGTLNTDEIALYLQYEGTSSSSVASFADSFAGPLVAGSAVTSSGATWNSSPATPVPQKLQVTFTAQHAGRVRGEVRLGKTSATVYVNPQITIT